MIELVVRAWMSQPCECGNFPEDPFWIVRSMIVGLESDLRPVCMGSLKCQGACWTRHGIRVGRVLQLQVRFWVNQNDQGCFRPRTCGQKIGPFAPLTDQTSTVTGSESSAPVDTANFRSALIIYQSTCLKDT